MKSRLLEAEPCASPTDDPASSLLGSLVYQARTKEEHDILFGHAENLKTISSRFRIQMRRAIREYRIWRTSHEICDVRAFYLQVEGKMMREHLKNLYVLYRESNRDLQAMRREMKRRFSQKSINN